MAEEQGQALIDRLRKGEALEAIAAEKSLTTHSETGIQRDAKGVDAQILSELFTMPHPAPDASTISGISQRNGDYAVVLLSKVVDGEAGDTEALGGQDAIGEAMRRSRGRSYVEHLEKNLRAVAKITYTKKEE